MEVFARVAPAAMTGEQRALYDELTSGVRAGTSTVLPVAATDGTLEGPFGILVRCPSLGRPVAAIGAQLRSSTTVSARTREVAVLRCAALADSAYEVAAHRRLAETVGLSDRAVESILADGDVTGLVDSDERLYVELAEAATTAAPVSPDLARASVAELSHPAVVEALVLGGYYRMLATLLQAYGIDHILSLIHI